MNIPKREDFATADQYLKAISRMFVGQPVIQDVDKARVLDINTNKPHKVSVVICVKCYKRWVSVRPVGTRLKDLECPNCGKGYVIETGEVIDE